MKRLFGTGSPGWLKPLSKPNNLPSNRKTKGTTSYFFPLGFCSQLSCSKLPTPPTSLLLGRWHWGFCYFYPGVTHPKLGRASPAWLVKAHGLSCTLLNSVKVIVLCLLIMIPIWYWSLLAIGTLYMVSLWRLLSFLSLFFPMVWGFDRRPPPTFLSPLFHILPFRRLL